MYLGSIYRRYSSAVLLFLRCAHDFTNRLGEMVKEKSGKYFRYNSRLKRGKLFI